MNIYVGNFSYDITAHDLKEVFSSFGHVKTAKIIYDKLTGKSKGFGFVEIHNPTEGQNAINGISKIKEKRITIKEAYTNPYLKSDLTSID